MSDTTNAESAAEATTEGGEQKQEQAFSQADVDKIVRDRLAQQAKNKFGDYDELKATAAGAKTVEQKLAELETKHAEAEARALRSEVAARHGISTEDRDLFLTGSDPDALEAQASRLAARAVEQKKTGNVAPKEGDTKNTGDTDKDSRVFVGDLFGGTE